MKRILQVLALIVVTLSQAMAGQLTPRAGWEVHASAKSYKQLLGDLKTAVKLEKMIVVTQAGPTKAAKQRGIEIPGNRVIGVYRNDYAVRALTLSVAAMIEAPIRFYVTDDGDGTATLSYKTPSTVFGPYFDDGGDELRALASELDVIFAKIAKRTLEE